MTHRGPFQPLLFCHSVIQTALDLAWLLATQIYLITLFR